LPFLDHVHDLIARFATPFRTKRSLAPV
jgi:hypothetical protein